MGARLGRDAGVAVSVFDGSWHVYVPRAGTAPHGPSRGELSDIYQQFRNTPGLHTDIASQQYVPLAIGDRVGPAVAESPRSP